MPKALVIRIHALLPETGVALDLDTTMHWAFDTGQRVSMWGPYEIKPDLYCRSREQLCFLKQGAVRYKALDTGYPTRFASNCIHAVSSSVGGHRPHVTSPSFGETASYYVLRRFHRWIINPKCKHEWLVGALGLNCYPLIHREWENPRTGVFWTSVREAFGVPAEGRGYVEGGEPNCDTAR
jgi:hypothetical protein